MPYIKTEKRPDIKQRVNNVAVLLHDKGDFNYFLYNVIQNI